jgi:hypothetical protein
MSSRQVVIYVLVLPLVALVSCTTDYQRGDYGASGEWVRNREGSHERTVRSLAGVPVYVSGDVVHEETPSEEREDAAAGILLWIGAGCIVLGILAFVAAGLTEGWKAFAVAGVIGVSSGMACFVAAITLHLMVLVAVGALVVVVLAGLYHARDISLVQWFRDRRRQGLAE